MSSYKYLHIIVILTALTLTFCTKRDDVVEPPKALFSVTPENGQTTTTFTFNTSGTTNPGLEKPELFYRWDWDGDGIWDTHFSKSTDYKHRYYAPGSFVAYMEVRNSQGLMDTISQAINVERGNSAPFPRLEVNPLLGHIRTLFTFDASGTYDDEDSLNTLKFRWDWEGDGWYDTEFTENPLGEFMYSEAGSYTPVVQVRDPWGMTAKTNRNINVGTHNPLLVVDFSWTPENGTTSDIITLDASASYDPENPGNELSYRWDLNNDKEYDTEWLTSPTLEHRFTEEGENIIKLEVRDMHGLTKSAIKEMMVLHSNQPPVAYFVNGTNYGNLTTEFYFDASGVSDDEDYFDILQVRWDFESDGIFDTEFTTTKTATHHYGVAGEFTITMEVKDAGGLTDTTSGTITVSPGTNPTEIVIDKDNGTAYGAVKIGSQWWTMENVDASAGRSCYRNSSVNCEEYGGLYNWADAMKNSTSPKAKGLCPDGYHIPTVEEWDELFDYLGRDDAVKELEPGGSNDFRLLYAGQINANGASEYLGTVVNFWTSTKSGDSNAWSYSMQNGKSQIWKVTLGQSYKISVRCVK